MKYRVIPLFAASLALAACAHRVASSVQHTPDTPGFLLGVWHGFIFPVAWVLSLFVQGVAVYAVPNQAAGMISAISSASCSSASARTAPAPCM